MQIPRAPAPVRQSPCRWAGTQVTLQVTSAPWGREPMFSHEKHPESLGTDRTLGLRRARTRGRGGIWEEAGQEQPPITFLFTPCPVRTNNLVAGKPPAGQASIWPSDGSPCRSLCVASQGWGITHTPEVHQEPG